MRNNIWITINESNHSFIKPNEYAISNFGIIKNKFGYEYKPEYHSSNGYDYTLMQCVDGLFRLFKFDELLSLIFEIVPYDAINKRIMIFHEDGNLNNNSIDNLKAKAMEEEWIIIDENNVKHNTYAISNFGRIKNINNNKILKPHSIRNYLYISLLSIDNKKSVSLRVHRLVAKYFLYNKFNFPEVNHINGDKSDNCINNLEWVDRSMNQQHAIYTGLQKYELTIDVDKMDEIRTVVLENDMSFSEIKQKYGISKMVLYKLIRGLSPYDQSNKYSIDDLKSIKYLHTRKPPLTIDEQDMIRDMLLSEEFDHSPIKVLNSIDKLKYPHITIQHIHLIKQNKKSSFRLSNKYDVDSLIFDKPIRSVGSKSLITTELIDIVIEELLLPENEGKPLIVYNKLKDQYPQLSYNIIKDIKRKRHPYNRSNKYDLESIEFPVVKHQ